MSHETFELIDRIRRDGSRAAMATLVRTTGTTPRKEGTKMFVGDGGGIFGSVTIGGCVDARVIEQSGEVLDTASPRLLNLQLGDEEAWEIGLTCGGAVDVLVEPLTRPTVELYARARAEAEAGRGAALATVLRGEEAGTRLFIDERGVVSGSGSPSLIEMLAREVPIMLRSTAASRTVGDVFIELVRPPVTLALFGAGAVAIPLVAFARTLGFRTIVIDARPRFATRERFAEADEIRLGIASVIAEELPLGPMMPVVLTAHDYKIDLPVLQRALATDAPYIGLLGSRRRGAAILQMLREAGVDEEQLARVRVPIGLDLGGETAAEIALSVVSEIVAVMHGRSGSPLSGRPA
jgi:xanthine dehydrogenase accessory factor